LLGESFYLDFNFVFSGTLAGFL